jgi:hypothetical protein
MPGCRMVLLTFAVTAFWRVSPEQIGAQSREPMGSFADGKRVLWASNRGESAAGRPIGAYVSHVIVSETTVSGERK